MTKKEIIDKIFHRLSANPGCEVFAPSLQNKLRNGRWGLRAYCLTLFDGNIVCRPWAGATCCDEGRTLGRAEKMSPFPVDFDFIS